MRVLTPLAVLSLLTLSTVAEAQQSPGVRTHDGFYARFGIGPGFTTGGNKADLANADLRGVVIGTEIALGTTIAPGFVVGGGQFSMIIPSPKYSVGGREFAGGAHHISGVGPFADYYLDPRGGLHAQAALMFSAGYLEGKDGRESAIGLGFGGMLGVGYEMFFGEQWSIGPILRLAYYRQSVEGSDSKATSTLSVVAPTLIIGVTYH